MKSTRPEQPAMTGAERNMLPKWKSFGEGFLAGSLLKKYWTVIRIRMESYLAALETLLFDDL